MITLFYTEKCKFSSSEEAVKKFLSDFFGKTSVTVLRNKNGKPYLKDNGEAALFFSVSHTSDVLFIAVSDKNVGIDAECLSRKIDYLPVIKKFSAAEQAEINDVCDFLTHWTVKESAVKRLGGTLARDLKKLRFEKGNLSYDGTPMKVTSLRFENYVVSVCGEADFQNTDFIHV